MKKIITAVLIFYLINSLNVQACMTLLIIKGASLDGSVIVDYSDDSELLDQRLMYVPAADHEPAPCGLSTTMPQHSETNPITRPIRSSASGENWSGT